MLAKVDHHWRATFSRLELGTAKAGVMPPSSARDAPFKPALQAGAPDDGGTNPKHNGSKNGRTKRVRSSKNKQDGMSDNDDHMMIDTVRIQHDSMGTTTGDGMATTTTPGINKKHAKRA